MKIQESNKVPDSTYFRTGDAEPDINQDGSITIYNGSGKRRGWGSPGVTSTVVLDDCDLIAIHVGFHHKHGGGQFWRYYTTDGTTTTRLPWGKLSDEVRQNVLDAYRESAPRWANSPGKLRSEYKKAIRRTQITYKLVALDDSGEMHSLYDGETQYRIGTRLAQAVALDAGKDGWGFVNHDGGFYSYPTSDQVFNLYKSGDLVPSRCLSGVRQLALIKCEASGRFAKFPNGKVASTYLTPLEIVQSIQVAE